MSDFGEIIRAGLNNPECSFFVGNWLGHWQGIQWILVIMALMLIYKAVDKLVIEPLIAKINSKIKMK